MRAAVLCNGPSRTLFTDPSGYDYIIGCNIPWTKVDATVIVDLGMVHYWYKKQIPTIPTWYSRNAWRETNNANRKYFKESFLGIIDPPPDNVSSGHIACLKVIELGYTEIDIYGCDSWWVDNTDSHTHQYVDDRPDSIIKQISGWRTRWKDIISSKPEVVINFIGEPK